MDYVSMCQCINCDLRDMFFGFVEPEEMDALCSSRTEKTFEIGDEIIRAGEEIVDFIYLKEGLVKLFRSDEQGKFQIIAIGKPMDFVSLLSVFSDTKYKYSVSALENSTTCIIDLSHVKNLAEQNGKFALSVMKKMSRISDNIILDLLEIRKKQLRGRIAHIILMFSKDVFRSEIFDLPISRKEFAEFIGMTTENVIRTLSEFRKDKILRIYGKSIEILDMDILQRISEHG
jgi:CRP-like cAMP-binding protein